MIKENIILKKDTAENWAKAKNFIPKEGEFICYIDNNNIFQFLKLGDGKTKVNDLPFYNNYLFELNNDTLEIKGGN